MVAKTEKLSITVPRELAARLREMVPQGEVSAFISQALDDRLQMEKQRIGLEAGLGAWKDEDYPQLKTPEDTQKWLRKLRSLDEERQERLRKLWDEE